MIRPAVAADLDAIVAVERACFERPWTAQMYAQELARPVARIDVRLAPELVGFVCTWHVVDEVHLLRVAVEPEAQRRGHARALVAHVLQRAADEGAACVDLEVARGNVAAVALYRALGFVQVGERPGYYSAPPDDALLLRASLPLPSRWT